MATRFYFPASTAAAVAPTVDAAWQYTSEYVSRRLTHVKEASSVASGTQIGPWTLNQKAIDRQYVSDPLAAGVAFTTSTTVKGQLMVREFATTDDTNQIILGIRVIAADGSTVQATLLAVDSYVTGAEFINNATMRNKSIANGDALTANYTTVQGDRLVIEIGYLDANSGSTPEGAAKWGENATDLPENETQTTDGAGWIEFSNTITFFVSPALMVFSGQPRIVPATWIYPQNSAQPGLPASALPTPTYPGWLPYAPPAPPIKVRTYHQRWSDPPYLALLPAPNPWLQPQPSPPLYARVKTYHQYTTTPTAPPAAPDAPLWFQGGPPPLYSKVKTYHQPSADALGPVSTPVVPLLWLPQPVVPGRALTFTYVQNASTPVDNTLAPAASPSDPALWFQGGPPPLYKKVRTYHQASADAPGPVNTAPAPSDPALWFQGGPPPRYAKVRTYYQATTPAFFDLTTPYFEQLPQPKYKRPSWRYTIQDRAEPLTAPSTPPAFVPAQQPQVVPPIARVKTHYQYYASAPGPVNSPASPSDPALWFQGGPPPLYAKVKTYHQPTQAFFSLPTAVAYVFTQQPQGVPKIAKVKTHYQYIAGPPTTVTPFIQGHPILLFAS